MSTTDVSNSLTVVRNGPDLFLAVVRNFNLARLGERALVPTAGYATGSFSITAVAGGGTTAVLTPVVSNHPDGGVVANHPDTTTVQVSSSDGKCGVSAGLPLEHAWFGVEVTTAHGSAATGELWICLKPNVTTPAI